MKDFFNKVFSLYYIACVIFANPFFRESVSGKAREKLGNFEQQILESPKPVQEKNVSFFKPVLWK